MTGLGYREEIAPQNTSCVLRGTGVSKEGGVASEEAAVGAGHRESARWPWCISSWLAGATGPVSVRKRCLPC